MEQFTHLKKMYKFSTIPFVVCSATLSGHCNQLGMGELVYMTGMTEEHAEASDSRSKAKIITFSGKDIVVVRDNLGQQKRLVTINICWDP